MLEYDSIETIRCALTILNPEPPQTETLVAGPAKSHLPHRPRPASACRPLSIKKPKYPKFGVDMGLVLGLRARNHSTWGWGGACDYATSRTINPKASQLPGCQYMHTHM